jgi:outer membrane protein assembly factor BamD (BamD/ComL family)
MKKSFLPSLALVLAISVFLPAIYAQGGARKAPDPATVRDPDLEKDSMHNLEVARQYFKLRKAYVAALQRCEEVIAGNPTFAKIDEVLFIAGESSLNLAEGKGKQKPSAYVIHEANNKRTLTAEEFRENARNYLSQLINEHPQSPFRKQAEQDLQPLGGANPKVSESSKQ